MGRKCIFIEKSANCDLDLDDFPFIDDCSYPKRKRSKSKVIFGKIDDSVLNNNDTPEYIIFNVGGISHNEITGINNLVIENKIPFNVIVGSTGIYNAEDYLNELKELNENFHNNENEDLMTTLNSNDNNNSNINISKNSNFKANDIELKVIGESNNEPMGEKI